MIIFEIAGYHINADSITFFKSGKDNLGNQHTEIHLQGGESVKVGEAPQRILERIKMGRDV